MAAILAKFISKKVLGETVKNNFGKDVGLDRQAR